MNVEEAMSAHGFRPSAGFSGEAYYTKFVLIEGKRAYVSIASADDKGFPISLEDPVSVVVFELKSGEKLGSGSNFQSLSDYLATFEGGADR